ncbi:MAG: protein kinase, partial [Acidobacteria bacterium]|nr:protein kinase [Acidobacteriota bacterium]
RVRITDFGLAIIGKDETEPNQVMGTPAYMAPEQFAGKGASVRSDIYALGLILYEIISGKRAFTASTIAEMRERKERAPPTAPSDIRTGLDPVVERIILRCIEKDPRSRPASVVQVAMALPGGDPLAAAIAAGETPSPEMVAALGAKEGLRPLIAWVLLALVVAGTAGTVFMGRATLLFLRVPIEKPPEVMAERAREFLRKAGYSERPVDSAYGFEGNLQYVRHVVNNTNAEDRWQHLETAGAQFWYRQSPKPLERVLSYPADFMTQEVSRTDPPLQYSGETLVQLDPQGRLVSFQALPPQVASVKEPASPDWTLLFAEAGLDLQQWKPTEPEWTPLWYADARAAWLGTLPHVPNVPVRIEAASFRGKPVSFEIIAPWTRPLRMGESVELWGQQAFSVTAWVLFFLTMAAGGAYFARRNLRLGRGDRRGAVRIVVFVTILLTISWVIEESHVPTIWELQLFFLFAGRTLFGAGLIWLLYIALEPFVRRKWPDMLVSWTRLLAGEWNDPLVGRDALAGAAIGALLSCAAFFIFGLFPRLLGGPPIQPAVITTLSYPSDGLTDILPKLLADAAGVFPAALAAAFLLVLFRVLLRSQWAAATSWMILRGLLWASVSETFWPGAMLVWILPLLELTLLMRFGLLAYMIATFVSTAFTAPLTFDTSVWYAGAGFLIMSLTAAIALFGFRFALAGRPLLPATAMED